MLSSDSTPLRYIVQKHKEKRDVNRGRSLFLEGMWRESSDAATAIHKFPSLIKDRRSEIFIPLLIKGMIREYVHHILSRP